MPDAEARRVMNGRWARAWRVTFRTTGIMFAVSFAIALLYQWVPSDVLGRALAVSFLLTAALVVVSLVLGFPLAVWSTRWSLRRKSAFPDPQLRLAVEGTRQVFTGRPLDASGDARSEAVDVAASPNPWVTVWVWVLRLGWVYVFAFVALMVLAPQWLSWMWLGAVIVVVLLLTGTAVSVGSAPPGRMQRTFAVIVSAVRPTRRSGSSGD